MIISFIVLSLSLLQLLLSLCLNYQLSLFCSLFIQIFHFFIFNRSLSIEWLLVLFFYLYHCCNYCHHFVLITIYLCIVHYLYIFSTFFKFLIDSFLLILAISRFNTDSIFSKCLKRCNAVLFLETNCASLNPREYYHYATKSIIQIYFPNEDIYFFLFFPEYHGGHHNDVTRSRDAVGHYGISPRAKLA